MRKLFLDVFDNYTEFYNNPAENINLKKTLKYDIPYEMNSILQLDPKKYLITGSYGVGNPTETPWIAIFDKSITVSAQHGFYVVILFRKDMQGCYLSLNQGTTYLRNKFKGYKPVQKMKEVATKLKTSLSFQAVNGLISEINLASIQQNAKAYEAANIQAKFYARNVFPSNEELAIDLQDMLENLGQIKNFIGIRTLGQVIDDLIYQEEINDVKFQEDVLISPPAKTIKAPRPVPGKINNSSNREMYLRDSKIAKEALTLVDYICEADPTHLTFISPITGKNFVEAHHLIPISNQANYSYSLDVPGNIISLCPNCHREIHHGTEASKSKLIHTFYEQRKEILNDFGIHENYIEVLKMYNL